MRAAARLPCRHEPRVGAQQDRASRLSKQRAPPPPHHPVDAGGGPPRPKLPLAPLTAHVAPGSHCAVRRLDPCRVLVAGAVPPEAAQRPETLGALKALSPQHQPPPERLFYLEQSGCLWQDPGQPPNVSHGDSKHADGPTRICNGPSEQVTPYPLGAHLDQLGLLPRPLRPPLNDEEGEEDAVRRPAERGLGVPSRNHTEAHIEDEERAKEDRVAQESVVVVCGQERFGESGSGKEGDAHAFPGPVVV